MKQLIESAASILAIFGAACLTLSVSYDLGYLRYLGISLAEVPTTISDHVRSTLVWLPQFALMALAVITFELFNRRVERGMTEEELIASSPAPKFTAAFRRSPRIFIAAVSIASPFVLLAIGAPTPVIVWMMFGVIGWFVIHDWMLSHTRVRSQIPEHFVMALRWVPATVIFFAFRGASDAEAAVISHRSPYVLQTAQGPVSGELMRSFGSFYLIRQENPVRYEFIMQGSVTSMSKTEPGKSNHSLKLDGPVGPPT